MTFESARGLWGATQQLPRRPTDTGGMSLRVGPAPSRLHPATVHHSPLRSPLGVPPPTAPAAPATSGLAAGEAATDERTVVGLARAALRPAARSARAPSAEALAAPASSPGPLAAVGRFFGRAFGALGSAAKAPGRCVADPPARVGVAVAETTDPRAYPEEVRHGRGA
jgi:hypothetical protein